MMEPPWGDCVRICRAAACTAKKAPERLIAIVDFSRSGVRLVGMVSVAYQIYISCEDAYLKNSANWHTPALLTKTSNRPHSLTVASTNSVPVSEIAMSPGTAISLPLYSAPASSSMSLNCSADCASG